MHTLNILQIIITAILVLISIGQLFSIMRLRRSLLSFIRASLEQFSTDVLVHVRDDPGFDKAIRKIAISIILDRLMKEQSKAN
jgi:hypothetical protein